MRTAGIKLWVLTGDKIETAMNIGFSVGILDKQMQIYLIKNATLNEVESDFDEHEQKYEANPDCKHALVLGGEALTIIEMHSDLTRRF